VVAVVAAVIVVIGGLWLLLRDTSPQPPGQHRRPGAQNQP
jgi:hypothetical protein